MNLNYTKKARRYIPNIYYIVLMSYILYYMLLEEEHAYSIFKPVITNMFVFLSSCNFTIFSVMVLKGGVLWRYIIFAKCTILIALFFVVNTF